MSILKIGIDEAGRCCLFGPVCIASVSLTNLTDPLVDEIKDSKKHGLGVFAAKDIGNGELIERCAYIVIDDDDLREFGLCYPRHPGLWRVAGGPESNPLPPIRPDPPKSTQISPNQPRSGRISLDQPGSAQKTLYL